MKTLQISFKDEAYPKVLKALNKLGDIDLEIVVFDKDFASNKEYIEAELKKINSGTAKFISLEEFEAQMDDVISSHENPVH